MAKVANPSTLTFPGQASRLTINLTNGTQAVSGLTLTDYFTMDGTAGSPLNGMVITGDPQASTDCPGGIVAADPGGDDVSVAGVNLAPGASCSLSVNVTSTKCNKKDLTPTTPAAAVASPWCSRSAITRKPRRSGILCGR